MPRELTPVKVAIRSFARKLAHITRARRAMKFPTYPDPVRQMIERYHDDVRYSTLALALQRIESSGVEGAIAEVGVYQGATSLFMHRQCPGRRLYLFDTFQGFHSGDLENGDDERFKDTSVEAVRDLLGDSPNLRFQAGHFPETARGLEGERFSLVMLDVDLYQPSVDVFQFFYPRMARGGYFFMHDYNSPESGRAVARAADQFMRDKPELLIEIPDYFGTALFRKI